MSTDNILCSSVNFGVGAEQSLVTVNAAAALTLTPAQLFGGVILCRNAGANTFTMPAAAALTLAMMKSISRIQATDNAVVPGSSFRVKFILDNAAATLALTASAHITLGNAAVQTPVAAGSAAVDVVFVYQGGVNQAWLYYY